MNKLYTKDQGKERKFSEDGRHRISAFLDFSISFQIDNFKAIVM